MTESAEEPLLLPGMAAALSGLRARIEAILARPRGLEAAGTLHDLRVALRRTASFARLTRGVPTAGDGEALRFAARDLRRALSPWRTHDVARARLKARFRRDPERRKTAERLAGRMTHDVPARATSSGRSESIRLAALRRAFAQRDAELGRLHQPLSGSFDARVEKRLRAKIERRLRRARGSLLAAGVPSAETLHPIRIAAKKLRYALELVSATMPGALELLEPLKRFQDAAGDAHDRAELIAAVRREAGRTRPPFRREALRLLPVLMRDAERALVRAQAAARRLLPQLERTELEWT
jgi:CHAD domain-containing protein